VLSNNNKINKIQKEILNLENMLKVNPLLFNEDKKTVKKTVINE
jgi:hypothetical protein